MWRRPRYTPITCFETFPFPAGLTPLDTVHQRTEAVADGVVIPANLTGEAPSAISDKNLEPNRPPALISQAPADIKTIALRETATATATAIAKAAHRMNTLREA